MVKNRGAFRILSSLAFKTVKNHREEKKKSIVMWQFFYVTIFFQFSKTVRNLKIVFSMIIQTNVSEQWSSFPSYTTFFVKNLIHYKTNLKHHTTMPSHRLSLQCCYNTIMPLQSCYYAVTMPSCRHTVYSCCYS